MKVLLKKKIDNVGGWWGINNRVIVNNLGEGGIRVYCRHTESVNTISDSLHFECGSDKSMLCSEFKNRRLKICDYEGKTLDKIYDVQFAYKCTFSREHYFFLGYFADHRDKKWFSYNPLTGECLLRSDMKSETDVITSTCGIVWGQTHLSFVDAFDFNDKLCSIPIDTLIGDNRSTPLQFKYVSVGQKHVVVIHSRTQRVILVNLEDGTIVFNKKNHELLNIDIVRHYIHIKNIENAEILSYSFIGGRHDNFSLMDAIDLKQYPRLAAKVINEYYFIFTPDAVIRIFDKYGNKVFESAQEESQMHSVMNLITPPTVKFSNFDLFSVRLGTDAFTPLSTYEVKF